MIEVFKTDVQRVAQAKKLVTLLLQNFPKSKINFDLDDCDRVLRVEGEDFIPEKVMMLVNENGFLCHMLA
ncbi:hypothetical protein CLV51_105135 [Chitinophaga niastensis]|uniref:Uncharacterized protein n=1 Tax=Chitinophaga niastensis TaxID=536980 RepID=A0A2P8HEX5_CHINA|nr:hypothetical protein [Chitinophaga niastensis]PSL44763.1 hypothetical protein CLV51_105135 [Chitinophaga niastensis]